MTKYIVGDHEFEDIDDVLDYCIIDTYHEDDYADLESYVNETWSGCTINGVEYSAYTIISMDDGPNYDRIRNDFCEYRNDQDREEGGYDLEHARNGDTVYIQDYAVHVVETDKDDDDEEESDDEALTGLRNKLRMQAQQKYEEDEQASKTAEDIFALLQKVGE